MDFSHKHQSNCIKHNQPIVFVNSEYQIRSQCLICLSLLPDNTLTQQFDQQYEKACKYMDADQKLFEQLLGKILKQKEEITSSLNNMVQLLQSQINFITDLKLKQNSIINSDCSWQTRIIDLNQISIQRQQVKNYVQDQLTELKNIFQSLTLEVEKLCSILEKSQMIENLKLSKSFQYELLNESSLKFENQCFALALNKDNTILAVACSQSIILYEFMNGRVLKELQQLENQKNNYEYCLYFMKQSNSFISGSHNKLVTIWTFDEISNKWIAKIILKEHDTSVTCILMNKIEDQFISGSCDSKVKFWKQKNEGWKCFQSFSTKYRVWDMSLNEMEDKLIICENDQRNKQCIEILMLQKNDKWNLIQKLKYINLGWRLSFIIEDQFLFAPQYSEQADIYDFNTNKQQFEIVQQFQVPYIEDSGSSFPCQFIKPLNILILKRGTYVYVIKMNQKRKFETIQTIEFYSSSTSGRIADDGQYLVIYYYSSRELQIRKIKFLD